MATRSSSSNVTRRGSTPSLTLEIEERDGKGRIARLAVNHPGKLNILNRALIDELAVKVEALASDAGLRALVLTGAGERAFIGGADIRDLAALDQASAAPFITALHRTCTALRHLPVPVIARIHGYTLGAGLEVAAACDLRIASERAMFGMPEVRVGIPSVVEAALLPKLIGHGRARRLLLTGETISAEEALSWGLVDAVASPDELDDAIERFVRPILAAGPQAVRLQKSLILEWEELPTAAAIDRGIDCFVSAFDTDEPARMAGALLSELRSRRK